MDFYAWFKKQPRPYWCPICQSPVTKWHEHHGPRNKWKPAPEFLIAGGRSADAGKPMERPGVKKRSR